MFTKSASTLTFDVLLLSINASIIDVITTLGWKTIVMQSNTLSTQDRTPSFVADIYPSSTFYQSISPDSILQQLTSLAALLQKFIDDHCKDTLEGYIWYREGLKISVADQTEDGEKPARLCAYMRHGGCVEDEWLAVHLLMLASEKFKDVSNLQNDPSTSHSRRLWMNISDEDGQFLMIEGAEELPDWIQPHNADGRLWIMDGAFHLLTLKHHPGDAESQSIEASLEEGKSLQHVTALKLLQLSTDSLASPRFAEVLHRNRMPSFPDLKWVQDFQHSTLIYAPIVAAKVIARFPQIVADAAEAFEGREGPKDARVLRDVSAMQSEQAFLIKIKLPRRMYATLLGERYFPPKVFGMKWRESVMKYWDLLEKEMKEGQRLNGEDEMILKEEGRRRDLGCKIVCGLELVHSNVKSRMMNNPKNLFDAQDEEVRSTASYSQFIGSLAAQGYFEQEVQDSYQWKQKEKEALRMWRSMLSKEDADDKHRSDDLAFVLDAVKAYSRDRSLPPHVDAGKSAQALRLCEDPDDWVYEEGESASEDAEGIALEQLKVFSEKLQGSDALFEGEEDDEEEDNTDEEGKTEEDEEERKKEALQQLVPPLAEGEWGAKPAVEMETDLVSDGVKEETRLKGFSSHAHYDGVVEEDQDEDDDVLRAGDAEEDRVRRARALGIEGAYEEEEKRHRMAVEDGDVEGEWVDEEEKEVGEKDVEEFIEFARKELGMSEEAFKGLLEERKKREKKEDGFERMMAGLEGELAKMSK